MLRLLELLTFILCLDPRGGFIIYTVDRHLKHVISQQNNQLVLAFYTFLVILYLILEFCWFNLLVQISELFVFGYER